jgi:hypothetical protein
MGAAIQTVRICHLMTVAAQFKRSALGDNIIANM